MTRDPLGVAVVGFGWMGHVHARAYSRVLHHYAQLPLAPNLVMVADPEPERRADAIERFGFAHGTARWHDVLDDDRVQAVSVTAPNFLHRQIGEAVARAGKHLWIEKPVGLVASDAETIASAVRDSHVQSAVGFNYRNAPAVEHARSLIDQGRIGTITNARFKLLTDYAAHPQGALTWRFKRQEGGSGVLGDLVSHGVDLARYLLGDIHSLVADAAIFIPERPSPAGTGSHFALAEGGELGRVENDDYVSCLVRFASGARGSLEASRVSVGDQCSYGFEIHGTKGALHWDFRRMGELGVSLGEDYLEQSVRTELVGPTHGEAAAFQPGSGIALGYDDLKVIEAARFLQSIVEEKPRGATVQDAVQSARALDGMARSAQDRCWVTLRE
ncbi:MAG: Gfo/Idh/MocA family protein [Acidimicrobiales bacterium]